LSHASSTLSFDQNDAPNTGVFSTCKFKNLDHVLNAFHEETLLIYFGTSNCGPCRLMKKELALVRKLIGKKDLKIFSVDTEKWPQLGLRYGIHRLPCILFVRDGEIQERMEGVIDAEILADTFRTLS
jgi:thiol-disulfide isomerase/thioredoxin